MLPPVGCMAGGGRPPACQSAESPDSVFFGHLPRAFRRRTKLSGQRPNPQELTENKITRHPVCISFLFVHSGSARMMAEEIADSGPGPAPAQPFRHFHL